MNKVKCILYGNMPVVLFVINLVVLLIIMAALGGGPSDMGGG